MGNNPTNEPKKPRENFEIGTIRDDGSQARVNSGFDLTLIDGGGNIKNNITLEGITNEGANEHYTSQSDTIKKKASEGKNASGTKEGVFSTGASLKKTGGDIDQPGLNGKPYSKKS